jgi:hypothetical protein
MVSGDRNNPLDRNYGTNQNPASPDHHQLTVVFDRQDSAGFTSLNLDTNGINFSNLVQLSSAPLTGTPGNPCTSSIFQVFTPGCPNYFLGTASAPMFGYYVNFPSKSATTGYLPKGINPPLVVANSLSYAYFTPLTSDPCTGGTGNTYSWLIADVMHPIVNDQRTGMFIPTGNVFTWTGVASNYIAIGTTSVLQAGTVAVANPQPGASITTPQINTTALPGPLLYPKVRVWRTVQ